MDRDGQILMSLEHLADRHVAEMRRAGKAILNADAAAGLAQSGPHLVRVGDLVRESFHTLARAAAVQLAEIEGDATPDHALRLGAFLLSLHPVALEVFDKFAAPGVVDGAPMWKAICIARSDVVSSLDATTRRVANDLSLGIAGDLNVRKHHPISVHHSGAGHVAINSPGSVQSVGGNQVSAASVDLEAVRALLADARTLLNNAAVSPSVREEVDDAILNVERELEQPKPDLSRVKRLLQWVLTTSEKVSIGVVSNLLAAFIKGTG